MRTINATHRAIGAAALAGALLAAVPAASAARPSEATYRVTFKAQAAERWTYRYATTDDCELTGVLCTKTTTAAGTATELLRTSSPRTVLVLRGAGGRPPIVGVGDGIPVVGESVRNGSVATVYGGPWAGANPNTTTSNSGCGRKALRTVVTFGWRGRRALSASASPDDDHGDCPTGPSEPPTWKGGAAPSLEAVLADAAPARFLGTKQFTVRGSRTFTGTYPSANESGKQGSLTQGGDITTTWTWEATFRAAGRRR